MRQPLFFYSLRRIDPLLYFFFFAVELVFFAVELVFFAVELVFLAVELVFFEGVLVVFAGSFGFSSGMASTPYSCRPKRVIKTAPVPMIPTRKGTTHPMQGMRPIPLTTRLKINVPSPAATTG